MDAIRRWLGRLLEAAGQQVQLTVVPNWRASRLDEERHLARLFHFLGVDCVYDVGANVGQYATMLRDHVGYQGRIVSFEPDPRAFAVLQRAAADDPAWTVNAVALGAHQGRGELLGNSISLLSSLRKLDPSSPHRPDDMTQKPVAVDIDTLESWLCRERSVANAPFLKLDTQGFDLEVARGAGDTIETLSGIQTEIAFQPIYDGAPDYNASIDFFTKRGFVLSRLVPIHDVHFPELVEMDAIFVNQRVLKRSPGVAPGALPCRPDGAS